MSKKTVKKKVKTPYKYTIKRLAQYYSVDKQTMCKWVKLSGIKRKKYSRLTPKEYRAVIRHLGEP